jgi:type VI secretion system protein ImpK
MVCLTDEVFLNLEWPDPAQRSWWGENLLESRIFRTHFGGGRVFEQITQLVDERRNSRRGLARVYLLALGLGFEGVYRGRKDQQQLARFRRDLWLFTRDSGSQIRVGGTEDVEPPGLHVDSGGSGRRSRVSRYWFGTAAAAMGLWLVISFVLWQNLHESKFDDSESLAQRISRIEQASAGGKQP